MKLEQIKTINHRDLPALLNLFETSFPAAERRSIEQLKEYIVSEERMSFNSLICDDVLAGLFIYWSFPGFYYLEYLAVFPQLRNQKIGHRLLSHVDATLQDVRLFEVEPAETEITKRRVALYERNGYQVLDRDYIQPPYAKELPSIPLWLMGNRPDPDQAAHVATIHQVVYGA